MKRLAILLPFIFTLSILPAAADTGLVVKRISAAHHARTMEMAVFYPGSGGTPSVLGENGVFHGIAVGENATLSPGKHPLVLLSHGWGGNFRRMGWLSKGLVDRGAIVVAVNHPNSTTGELDNLLALDHWTRAQDLSAALDDVLADPAFASAVDATRISALGFSYGGWTALSLGGLTGKRDGLDAFCSDPAKPISHCADILKAGIKIADIDRGRWEASYKDRRITAVAAIDPALTWGLGAGNTTQLDVPVLLIGLGTGQDRLHATDTSATGSAFESLFPAAQVETIAPASHFTALGLCKPEGEAILADEKDDPVCTDPPGTDRRAVMARIIELSAHHLGLR